MKFENKSLNLGSSFLKGENKRERGENGDEER
jgi:hypothetical protein